MRLGELVSGLGSGLDCPAEARELEVTGIAFDSRQVAPGNLFVAISGYTSDGHDYVQRALSAGAVAAVVEHPVEAGGPVLVFPGEDNRRALALLAAEFYQRPWMRLSVVGITGTNGKTSTAHMLRWMLERTGTRTGTMGTIGHLVAGHRMPAGVTTPESLDVTRFMAMMVRNGDETCVMEVSSHALSLERVSEVRFDIALFTNITQDHLDFHEDMQSYLAAKMRIFDLLKRDGRKVVGAYSPGMPRIEDSVSFGPSGDCAYRAENITTTVAGSSFTVVGPAERVDVTIRTPGEFNVYNACGALAAFSELGGSLEEGGSALEAFPGVPGRFERVDLGQPFLVAVDYAHTPDALRRVLEQASRLGSGRLIVAFGCGGDRDRSKRPEMGRIAREIADVCVVTSDNPRTEDPEGIIEDILEGMSASPPEMIVEPDRRKAIRAAIGSAGPGDVVIIAGKGHEDYQIIGTERNHFDDREECRLALEDVLG